MILGLAFVFLGASLFVPHIVIYLGGNRGV